MALLWTRQKSKRLGRITQAIFLHGDLGQQQLFVNYIIYMTLHLLY